MRYLKKWLFLIMGMILLLYLLLIFIGGGFGEKKTNQKLLPGANEVLLFAHRGLCDTVPENSFRAVELAKEKGFSALEIDLIATADQSLILFHDLSGQRLLNKDIKLSSSTYTELQELPLYFNGRATDHKISRLADILEAFGNDFVFYLDLKNETLLNFRWMVENINSMIKEKDLQDQIIIASSNLLIIAFIEYYYPQIRTAFEGFDAGKEWVYDATPKKFRPDFLASSGSKLNSKHIDWLKKRNLLDRKIVYGGNRQNYKDFICRLGIKKLIIDDHPLLKIKSEVKTICAD